MKDAAKDKTVDQRLCKEKGLTELTTYKMSFNENVDTVVIQINEK